MIQLTLYMSTLMMGFLFMQMNHPLSMGLILLMQTMLIACLTGMITKTFWFSYILFLIFIGGMLVLFIYVTSLASNEMFSLPQNYIIYFLLFLLFIIAMLNLDKMLIFNMNNNEMNSIMNMNSFLQENMLNLNKLYNYPTNMLTIMMINYLLFTMIITVKITKLFYGPLRSSL